jgi:hypothetical protein
MESPGKHHNGCLTRVGCLVLTKALELRETTVTDTLREWNQQRPFFAWPGGQKWEAGYALSG